MDDLQAPLQTAVGDAYRIEKELGGGGMSRVFVAQEVALGRRVVIKVLPPDLAAGVNVERFRREIQLAASLQHPHVVQLLSAGSADQLLYYVMPFIPGESLRAKLAREGALPIAEAVRILRDVMDALAYAHAQGVVHRDIKPDNVMISGKHAVVMDFGVAKAVSASSGQSTLTSLGVALGTPAYMAPEQAAADPHVDHRADFYAVGVLGYEMVCGRLPFAAATPQAMLAAHVTAAPEPMILHRPAVPAALNELVMRCLEKHPADRWQRAEDLLGQLEAMATPSGGMAPTPTGPVSAAEVREALRYTHPIRVAALFAGASVALVAVVYVLVRILGLPDWVLAGAVGLLAVGLPIMIATGMVERQRVLVSTGRLPAPPRRSGWRGWLTWRKALAGGVAAFAALAIATGTYMAMRFLGIGPVGTLVASGVLKHHEMLILTDFENRAADTTLGPSLTEAFRVDLSQSPTIRLADAQVIGDALARMQRGAGTRLDGALGREVAVREGIKAVVVGQIDPVGRGFVLSASLVSSVDGQVLTAVRETADDDRQLIGAIDRLSRKLRERIGESLTTIRSNPPLERVTTASLRALRTYTQAISAEDAGDVERAITLLAEATTLDTGFAMAYRKLAVVLDNSGTSTSRAITAATKAFEHRDRLPEVERYQTIAYYYLDVDYDLPKVVSAYRSVLEREPDNTTALNNLAIALNDLHRWAEAESLALHATTIDNAPVYFANALTAQLAQGHFADAHATMDRFDRTLPRSPQRLAQRIRLNFVERDFATAQQTAIRLRQEGSSSLLWRARSSGGLVAIAEVEGRLAAAKQHLRDLMAESEQRGVPGEYLGAAVRAALIDTRYRNRPADALRQVELALQRYPLAELPLLDRPYGLLAWVFAEAGRPAQARQLLSEYVANVPEGVRRGEFPQFALAAVGAIAVAENRTQDAATAFRSWSEAPGVCVICGLFELAGTYDRAHQSDSALAVYERVVNTPNPIPFPAFYALAPAYKRLGELYEERGDRAKAREYYANFAELWKDADPELQPVVRDVRARIARLGGDRPR